jgi:hypothetical protein
VSRPFRHDEDGGDRSRELAITIDVTAGSPRRRSQPRWSRSGVGYLRPSGRTVNEQSEPASRLPRQAAPGESGDLGEDEASRTTLSVLEAARRYGISIATVRRKLKDGEIPGAFKAPGPKGDEWRLPVSGLLALGYRAIPDNQMEPREEKTGAEMRELFNTMNRLMNTLDAERRQLMAAGQGSRTAEIEAARLQAELFAETERRRRAEAETAALRAAHQRQQETIDELSRALGASDPVWGRGLWALLFACVGGLIGYLVGG